MNVYFLSKLNGISRFSTKVGKCKTSFCAKLSDSSTQFSAKDNAITRYDYSYDSQGSFCKPLEDFTDLIDLSKIERITFDKIHRLLKVDMKWKSDSMEYPTLITDGKNHDCRGAYEYLRIGDGCLSANFSDDFKLKMAEQIGMNTTYFLGLPSNNYNNAVDKATYDELENTISLSFLFEIVVRLSVLDLDFAFNFEHPDYKHAQCYFERGSSIFKVFDRGLVANFAHNISSLSGIAEDSFASYVKEDRDSYGYSQKVDAQDLISPSLFNHVELIRKHKRDTINRLKGEVNTMASSVLGTLKSLTDLNNVKL
jgi:hypothetical protein